MVILVLMVPLSGAHAGTWAPPATIKVHKTVAAETPIGADHFHLRTEVGLTAASADGTCHSALPGTPCHPEHLLPVVAEPCSRDFAREHLRADRRQITAGLIPPSIYHPPRSR